MATSPEAMKQPNAVAAFMNNIGPLDTPEPPSQNPNPAAHVEPPKEPAQPTATPQPKVPEAPKEPERESDDKWPRSAQEWKKFRDVRDSKYKEKDEAISNLTKEIDALKKQPKTLANTEELERLKKERDDFSERLKMLDIERHPDFQQRFGTRMEKAIDLAKRVVPSDRADKLASVLRLPDSEYKSEQLEKLTEGLSALQQSRLGAVLNDLAMLDTERQSELQKARDQYAAMTEKQASEAKANQDQIRALAESAIAKYRQEHPLYKAVEGDEKWNKSVEERISAANAILFGNPNQETIFQTVMQGVAMPALLESSIEDKRTISRLEAQIREMSAAQPSVMGGSHTTPGTNVQIKVAPGTRPQEAGLAFAKALWAQADQ